MLAETAYVLAGGSMRSARTMIAAPDPRLETLASATFAVAPVSNGPRVPVRSSGQLRSEFDLALTRVEDGFARPAAPHDRVNFVGAEGVTQRIDKARDLGHRRIGSFNHAKAPVRMHSIAATLVLPSAVPLAGVFAVGAIVGTILPAIAESIAIAVLRSPGDQAPSAVAPTRLLLPVSALASATLCVLCAATFGISPAGLAAWFLCCSLLVAADIDHRHHLLPDAVTGPLLWIGLLSNVGGLFTSLPDAVLGAVAGYLALWALSRATAAALNAEGIGHGDFKLFAALGGWLGWQALLPIALAAGATAVTIGLFSIAFTRRHAREPLAFGPYLALAAIAVLLVRG
jgi:prepilin signal peptidase PulO-like enzyme (type II secretory pathway)